MALTIRVDVHPDIPGGFLPTTYQDLIQQTIHLPGLDPQHINTLVDVTISPDGNTAVLTILSEPRHPQKLDSALRVEGPPPARVRAFDQKGVEMHTGAHPAPLWPGTSVSIGTDLFLVAPPPASVDPDVDPMWPGRDRKSGMCRGDVDWQHVVLIPQPPPSTVPTVIPVAPIVIPSVGG